MELIVEQDLLFSLSKGDPRAFEMLFLHHFPRLKRFMFSLLKNEEEAEDLAQDIFVKIWQNRSSVASVHNFSAYLYRMARNAVYSHLEHEVLVADYAARKNTQPAPSQDELEELLFAKELKAMIDLSVAKMPPQRKHIYEMSRNEGLSNDDIAQRLSISKRTVEVHISAALADIRKVIRTLLLFF